MFLRSISIISIVAIGVATSVLTEFVPKSTTRDEFISNIKSWQEQNFSGVSSTANQNESSLHMNTVDGNNILKNPLNLRVKHEIFSPEQMDTNHDVLTGRNKFCSQRSLSESTLIGLSVKVHSLVYADALKHRHDKFMELKQSFGPHIDNDLCLRQLEQLNHRADTMNEQKYSSKDMNLYTLLGTYGRVPPGVSIGSFVWAGMYDSCLDMRIRSQPEGSEVPTRYCWALVRLNDWSKGSALNDMLALKFGVCLPRACDSLRYKNKYQRIQRLIEFNVRPMDRHQSTLDMLYCLPDDDSQLRSWWKSPRTLQAVVVLAGWLTIVIFATIKYEIAGSECHSKDANQTVKVNSYYKIYQMLAITNNIKLLFDTTKASSLLEKAGKAEGHGHNIEREQYQQKEAAKTERIVDLRCLDGIKIICMSYVIMGHVLMCLTSIISNGSETVLTQSPAFFLANLMPAFAVNSFFTITGILTCYLLFKENQIQALIARPIKWVAFILYRYLRIMPIYAVVVYYCKHLSKFTGSGPMWDYGTSSLAPRRQCEDESWLWTLLFGANFKSPIDHCIPSAWYLANDFQFFLVTPIFLIALYKRPEFGQRLLKFSILAGYLAGFLSVLLTDATDMRPIAKFMPHGFKTYVTFLSPSYTRPYYRIPPYLCGLLFGYKLYTYEKVRPKQGLILENEIKFPQRVADVGWSYWFEQYGMKMSLIIMIVCALTPVLATHLTFNKFWAQIMVATITSSYHILFALAIGFYILLASTGHGNQFINDCLSASFWKPLARLSLCVVLINIELINYIVQIQRQETRVNFISLSAHNLLGIVTSYIGATVLCILFEAPIRAMLNQCLTLAMKRLKPKQKNH